MFGLTVQAQGPASMVSTGGKRANDMSALIDFVDPLGGREGLRCAFAAPLRTLVAHTPAQVKPVLDAVQEAARAGQWCVGFVRYEAAPAFDAALSTHPADGVLAWFGVYEHALPWPESTAGNDTGHNAKDTNHNATDAGHGKQEATLRWHSKLTRAAFDAHMTRIHEAIAAGDFYQVNYTTLLHGTFSGAPEALFARLQRAQPGAYAACIDTGDEQVLSVSPELFFDWDGGMDGGQILTRPMKGTAARGATPADDVAQVRALTNSPKERAENVMIVDLLRNDLSRIAQPHSVRVPALLTVQTLPTVHQMVSDVRAQTQPGTTLADVFGALFPCGSITGAPKVRAMQEICALEPEPRGVYCGAVGVVRPGGHATFNVAIRTLSLRGAQFTCGIGSGITADATADAEWQEWQIKQRFLERASAPFELLETLRLQDGEFHNLGAHLARLSKAASHFGYEFDEALVRQALASLTPCDARSAWRVRLLLAANGVVRAEKFILNQTPAPVFIALAATPFTAHDSEFTRFKTTRRSHYDVFAPTDPGVFDTLLYNPHGELTECTRGNIAVLLDGHWVTPPLRCGLLGGVGRQIALDQGRITEQVVRLDDLARVQALAFINSLRGWVAAKLLMSRLQTTSN